MQLEYDAPCLFRIKKSHADSILIFGAPNDSDPFLLHLSDGRIELRSIYGVAEVPDTASIVAVLPPISRSTLRGDHHRGRLATISDAISIRYDLLQSEQSVTELFDTLDWLETRLDKKRYLYPSPLSGVGIAATCDIGQCKLHYFGSLRMVNPSGVVPKGPKLNFSD